MATVLVRQGATRANVKRDSLESDANRVRMKNGVKSKKVMASVNVYVFKETLNKKYIEIFL